MYGCVALSVRVHVQNVDPGCFVCMCIIIIININLAFGPHLAVLPGKGLHKGGQEAEGETEGLRVTSQIQRARATQGTQQGLCAHQADPFLPLTLLVIG